MTLELTAFLRPLVLIPIVGVLLLGTAIAIDRLRRRHPRGHGA